MENIDLTQEKYQKLRIDYEKELQWLNELTEYEFKQIFNLK